MIILFTVMRKFQNAGNENMINSKSQARNSSYTERMEMGIINF